MQWDLRAKGLEGKILNNPVLFSRGIDHLSVGPKACCPARISLRAPCYAVAYTQQLNHK